MNKFIKINYNHWSTLGFEDYDGYHAIEFIYENESYIVCPDLMAYHVSKNGQWITEYEREQILLLDSRDYYNLMCILCVGINFR